MELGGDDDAFVMALNNCNISPLDVAGEKHSHEVALCFLKFFKENFVHCVIGTFNARYKLDQNE